MALDLKTSIVEVDEILGDSNEIFSNNIRAREGLDFNIISLSEKVLTLNTATGAALNFNIFENQDLDNTKVSFIFINCQLIPATPSEEASPIKINITLKDSNDVTLTSFKSSQFEIGNVEDLVIEINLSNIVLTETEIAKLTIITGQREI